MSVAVKQTPEDGVMQGNRQVLGCVHSA